MLQSTDDHTWEKEERQVMKLGTMWKVDSTVTAEGSSPVAEQILRNWEHDPGSVRFFRSSANFVYVFHKEGKRYFLRFADSSERSRETIEAEVDIVNWLAGVGISVATPLQSRNGRFVETTATPAGAFHAVVFAGLEGSQLDVEDLDDSRFREWGAALGRLHFALKAYPGSGRVARGAWRDHLDFARKYVPEDELAVRHELDQIASVMAVLPVNRDNYGLIHFDFELDNLYWRNDTIGILDFDDCSHYWYVADIAFALGDLFGAGVKLDEASVREFVRGYSSHQLLDDELLSRLPVFLRMADLIDYARLARALDLPNDQAYPEWLSALNRKLKGRMEAYKASLAL